MNSQKIFVEKSIEINAPIHTVWDVLKKPKYTKYWVSYFGGIDGEIVSDWEIGSPVLWKDKDNRVIVEGEVTALEPDKLVRFTVFDTRSKERPPATEEDGITFLLSTKNNKTTLNVRQGDFSVMPDGAKYRDMSAEIWDNVLSKIKEIAEGNLDKFV